MFARSVSLHRRAAYQMTLSMIIISFIGRRKGGEGVAVASSYTNN